MHFLPVWFFVLSFPSTSNAVRGISDACCNLAINQSAWIPDPLINPATYTCGQVYSASNIQLAAPDLKVNLTWCNNNCGNYALYPAKETNAWALPLVQFILPAVIFSMAIPRRLAFKPFRRREGAFWFILLFFADGLVLILDVTFWVFAIMIAPAPFMLSGLFEVMLDVKVTLSATAQRSDLSLTKAEKVEVLTAVLAGNLAIEGAPSNPQQQLRKSLGPNVDNERTEASLIAMLTSQSSFGGVVGAAILLYIGSFVYTLLSLSTSKGDHATARALAFGIWWMTMVHVSIISGSLLATNNPSVAAAIVGRDQVTLTRHQRRAKAAESTHLEDRVQAEIESLPIFSLVYPTRFEPAWMWSRGKSKAFWLRRTSAWQNHTRFQESIHISGWEWFLITAVAYFLVFVPCALAFTIEYLTPSVGVGCRAMTILLYTVTQTIFVLLSFWSHYKAVEDVKYWGPWKERWVRITTGTLLFFPTWLLALFATFVGTLMQITGIFQNCACAATYAWSPRKGTTVSLASDTQQDRQSARSWDIAGYFAVIFLLVVTYLGWFLQRNLRDYFDSRVKALQDINNGAPP